MDNMPDIKIHFIGSLQKNKVSMLVGVPQLTCIESVNSIALADVIQKELVRIGRKLDVMVEVNISEEESKSGIKKDCVYELIEHIIKNCTQLNFIGIMTIGEAGEGDRDFHEMANLAKEIKNKFSLDKIELSMGMSADYEKAISCGATTVRIGSTIFGARVYKK